MIDIDTPRNLWGWVTALLVLATFAFAPDVKAQGQEIVVTDDITEDTVWESENTYILNGLVFVGPRRKTGRTWPTTPTIRR